jgi:hypothetical protein
MGLQQAHQQPKKELGLDRIEGLSWQGFTNFARDARLSNPRPSDTTVPALQQVDQHKQRRE